MSTRIQVQAGPITVLTLESDDGLHLLSVQTARTLLEQFQHLKNQRDLQVVILTGQGQRAFCAGADMRELLDLPDPPAYVELGHELVYQMEHLPCPIIGAINGHALGAGFTLAMSCDLRIMSETASIGQLAVRNGLVPPFGNIQQLLNIAGVSRGRELIYTGRRLNAQQAEQYQLVHHVAASDQLMAEAHKMAEMIALSPNKAIRYAKSIIVSTLEQGYAVGLHQQEEALIDCLAAPETRAIMQGFLQKSN